MLLNLLDGWFKYNVGEAAFYAVFGFVFVFLGIVLLILIFDGLGWIMKRVDARKSKKEIRGKAPAFSAETSENEGELSPEIVAAITAAVSAAMQAENVKCDFIVRRIQRR